MTDVVIVAIISLLGTLGGSFGGIIAANRLTNYRLEQLENKVAVHNNLIDRMYRVEKAEALLEEDMKVANHRIEDLEQYHK